MGLAKGSRNVEAAHWFVNRLISPEIQLELSKRSGSVADPYGYTWDIAMVKEELSVDEMHRRFAAIEQPQETPAASPRNSVARCVTLTPTLTLPAIEHHRPHSNPKSLQAAS